MRNNLSTRCLVPKAAGSVCTNFAESSCALQNPKDLLFREGQFQLAIAARSSTRHPTLRKLCSARETVHKQTP